MQTSSLHNAASLIAKGRMIEQWSSVWINFTPCHSILDFQTALHRKWRILTQPKLSTLLFYSADRHGAGILIHTAGLRIIIKCFQWCNADLGQATVPWSTNKMPGQFLAKVKLVEVLKWSAKNMTARAKKMYLCKFWRPNYWKGKQT